MATRGCATVRPPVPHRSQGMTPGGKERSLSEWTGLFAGAGLAAPEVLTVVNGLAALRTRRA